MINGVIIKQLVKYEDARGWLAEIWRDDETNYRPAMGYVSVTHPGVIRGPHEHKMQSDCFIFLGPGNFELYLWDRREGNATCGEHIKIEVGVKNPMMIIIPPGVVHGYKCVGDQDAWCFNLSDRLYKGEGKKEEPDEIRWEEQADSSYKII
ncbi:MAG: dTDP-4-dehydrorhamnose 3,5-epimerase [Parcubacteria group bacterium GW2011_GWA2_43_9b]|nr:MAG: dTDP-4-dehydrorhamnose 3,5-epimerase [Parcubacteria group bacterium GW2011_GWA2_43_9b]